MIKKNSSRDLKLILRKDAYKSLINSMEFSMDNTVLYLSTNNGELDIYNLNSGQLYK